MTAARDLVLLVGSIAETTTPEQLNDRARDEFAALFGSVALDNGLPAQVWQQLQKGYLGGYHHGYAAAVADFTLAAALKYTGGAK